MRRLLLFGALAAASLLFAGVGPAGAGPTTGAEEFCQLRIDFSKTIGQLFATEEPEQEVIDKFSRQLDEIDGAAPPEIAAQVATVTAALRQALENEFEEDPFEDPAVREANAAINDSLLANCGFERVDVTGLEYEFQGIPKTIPAGPVAFTLTNEGAEVHELILFRIRGDKTIKEILELPERQQEKQVRVVEAVSTPQGETDAIFVDLKPGRYGAICFVPVGTTDPSAEPEDEDVESHAEEGMYLAFRVKKSA